MISSQLSEKNRLAIRMILTSIANGPNLKEEVRKNVNSYLEFFISKGFLPSSLYNKANLEVFIDNLTAEYARENSIEIKSGKILDDGSSECWLSDALKSGKIQFKGYNGYVELLKNRHFNSESINALDEITSCVLEHLGNPLAGLTETQTVQEISYRDGIVSKFKTHGLLMGDVQSGKTSAFTGICHKAVDAGYRFIIVLTGTKTSLRAQTQYRLNRDLLGKWVDSRGHQHDVEELSHNSVNWKPLTSKQSDFSKSKTETILRQDGSEVYFAVMKKNASVLRNLLQWLKLVDAGAKKLPVLLIDDEADSASIDTSIKGSNPTVINQCIRDILNYFDKSAYLAVTATPFANIYIDPQLDKNNELHPDVLPDLFPENFIYVMPSPLGYYGVDQFFGDSDFFDHTSLKYRTLIPVFNKEKTDYEDEDKEIIENSLRRAFLYFCCVCVLTDLKKVHPDFAEDENASMLVHIERYKDSHHEYEVFIEDLLNSVSELAQVESGRVTDILLSNPLYIELEKLWDCGCREELWYQDETMGEHPKSPKEITGLTWEQVWKKRFGQAVRKIQLVVMNTDNKDKSLDGYYEGNNGRVVVIGGDALTRGLTLEGLAVCYFARKSYAYDSLLQMGRWFGYKSDIADYMKIWISDFLIDAYEFISDALTEFKEDLETMRLQGKTPREFGLRVLKNPKNAKMMVTAANKRRNAAVVKVPVDLSGKSYTASTFSADPELRHQNSKVIQEFIQEYSSVIRRGQDVYPEASSGQNDLVVTGVESCRISELLNRLIVPLWSDSLDIRSAAAKIRDNSSDRWIVRVISTSASSGYDRIDLFGINMPVSPIYRTFVRQKDRIQPNHRSVTGPADFARHWSPMKIKTVAEKYRSIGNTGQLSHNMVLAEPDEDPQLLIYPLMTKKQDVSKHLNGTLYCSDGEVMMTVAFGLPGRLGIRADGKANEYLVNMVYLNQNKSID